MIFNLIIFFMLRRGDRPRSWQCRLSSLSLTDVNLLPIIFIVVARPAVAGFPLLLGVVAAVVAHLFVLLATVVHLVVAHDGVANALTFY